MLPHLWPITKTCTDSSLIILLTAAATASESAICPQLSLPFTAAALFPLFSAAELLCALETSTASHGSAGAAAVCLSSPCWGINGGSEGVDGTVARKDSDAVLGSALLEIGET